MIQAVPAKNPSSDGEERDDDQVGDQRDAGEHDARQQIRANPNSRRRDIAEQEPRSAPHAERESGEDGGEEHAVARIAATEVGDVDPGQPDHDAARREGAGDADDQAADHGRAGRRTPSRRG